MRARFMPFPEAAGLAAAVLGAVVLAGWALGSPGLKSVLPGLSTMKANTAACFLLCGAGLWLSRRFPDAARRRGLGQACGAAAALVGLATLAEHFLGRDLGIDQILFRDDAASPAPGRMSIVTAASFLLLGSALAEGGRSRRSWVAAEPAAALALLLGLLSMIVYAYDVHALYGMAAFSSVALHTAAAFVVLSAGVLARGLEGGVVARFSGDGLGSLAVRRLIPVALVVQFAIGWLRLHAQELGYFDLPFGLTLMVLAGFVVFSLAVLLTGAMIDRVEAERRALSAEKDEIAALNRLLAAANRELETFSYSVAHDLRSPLRAIDGFSRIVLEDYGPKLDEEARRLLGNVRANTQRMGRLIDDLLAFSRVGRQELRASRVDMAALARAAFDEFKPAAPRKAELVLASLPAATGDIAMLRQVWANLLSNAVKYAARADPARIEVGGEAGEVENRYWVRDNGTGFDMRYVEKLFGIFQRLHSQEEFEGTGVGLAIVQRIVHRHGGRVWAEGSVGAGATFHFTLPSVARGAGAR